MDNFRHYARHQKGATVFNAAGFENIQQQAVDPLPQIQRGVFQKIKMWLLDQFPGVNGQAALLKREFSRSQKTILVELELPQQLCHSIVGLLPNHLLVVLKPQTYVVQDCHVADQRCLPMNKANSPP
jgi:hypothetical protein